MSALLPALSFADVLADVLIYLNPEIPHNTTDPAPGVDEFQARWYLHPKQHALEIVISILVFGPLLYLTYNKMTRQLRETKVHYEPTRIQVLWAYGLLMSLLLQAPLKLDPTNFPSHPAFFLQPCHVSSVAYFLATVIPSETSFVVFHSLSLLTWGPSLAFCFPNFPATQYETVFFYLQHVFLCTAPLFACDPSHHQLYKSWHWNYFPWVVLAAYHWWTLIPWSVWTGINVATMLIPPPALVSFKQYYRPVQGFGCLVLHTISVGSHLLLCSMSEHMHPSPKAKPF